jgi:hypothetical protein
MRNPRQTSFRGPPPFWLGLWEFGLFSLPPATPRLPGEGHLVATIPFPVLGNQAPSGRDQARGRRFTTTSM